MYKLLQPSISNSERLDEPLKMVFADAIKIAEDEEEFEVCAGLYKVIQEINNRCYHGAQRH